MTPPKKPWTWCRETGCDTKIIFARRAGHGETGKRRPYEYQDRAPFSLEATGCHVIVAGEAWTPAELIEHYQVRLGVSDDKARELVTGYPFHRPHWHDRPDTGDDAA